MEWREHCDKSIVPICQGENTELVEDAVSVGDRGKEPAKVVLVSTLGEEGDDAEKCSGIKAREKRAKGRSRRRGTYYVPSATHSFVISPAPRPGGSYPARFDMPQ